MHHGLRENHYFIGWKQMVSVNWIDRDRNAQIKSNNDANTLCTFKSKPAQSESQ